jgi:hypothetical protein
MADLLKNLEKRSLQGLALGFLLFEGPPKITKNAKQFVKTVMNRYRVNHT